MNLTYFVSWNLKVKYSLSTVWGNKIRKLAFDVWNFLLGSNMEPYEGHGREQHNHWSNLTVEYHYISHWITWSHLKGLIFSALLIRYHRNRSKIGLLYSNRNPLYYIKQECGKSRVAKKAKRPFSVSKAFSPKNETFDWLCSRSVFTMFSWHPVTSHFECQVTESHLLTNQPLMSTNISCS